MKLNQVPKSPANRVDGKRKGRGISSGKGKTAGRGMKGQKCRSGGYHRVGFEGGQMPLQRRLPKRGFTNPFKKSYALIKVQDLEIFATGTEVNTEELLAKGLVDSVQDGIKVLGGGTLSKNLVVHVDKASQSAKKKIEEAGGRVILNEGSS